MEVPDGKTVEPFINFKLVFAFPVSSFFEKSLALLDVLLDFLEVSFGEQNLKEDHINF